MTTGSYRAARGGQEGVNGFFYKGGQFLPHTQAAPGKWKLKGKWINSARELVAPGEFAFQPTPFSRSLFRLAGVGYHTVLNDGRLTLNLGPHGQGVRAYDGTPITLATEIRPGVKGVLGKEALTLGEIIDAWNNGQRWFDVQPDAETITTTTEPEVKTLPSAGTFKSWSTAVPKLGTVNGWTLFRDTLEGEHFVLMTSFNSVGFDTEQAARDWAAENKATKGDFNEAKTKATPAAPTSAEQAIRNAFGALPSVTLGEFYPITVTHNGRTQQFLASQRALKRPNQPAPALTLLQIQQGRMIAGAELQDLAYTYKLNGKNELTEESVKPAGDALMKRWSEAFATAPEIEPLLTAPTPEEVVARQDAAEAAQREAEAAETQPNIQDQIGAARKRLAAASEADKPAIEMEIRRLRQKAIEEDPIQTAPKKDDPPARKLLTSKEYDDLVRQRGEAYAMGYSAMLRGYAMLPPGIIRSKADKEAYEDGWLDASKSQAELKRKAEGRESYTDAQAAVAADVTPAAEAAPEKGGRPLTGKRTATVERGNDGRITLLRFEADGKPLAPQYFDNAAQAHRERINWEWGTKAADKPLYSQMSDLDAAATSGYKAGKRGENNPPDLATPEEEMAWRIGYRRAKDDAAEAAQREAEAADRKAAELERQIQLAADSIRELRKVDVDRVLTQDGIDAAALGDYIKRNRPEFAAEVDEVLAEIEQYAESVKAEPAQSPDDFAAQAELERRVQARLRE